MACSGVWQAWENMLLMPSHGLINMRACLPLHAGITCSVTWAFLPSPNMACVLCVNSNTQCGSSSCSVSAQYSPSPSLPSLLKPVYLCLSILSLPAWEARQAGRGLGHGGQANKEEWKRQCKYLSASEKRRERDRGEGEGRGSMVAVKGKRQK